MALMIWGTSWPTHCVACGKKTSRIRLKPPVTGDKRASERACNLPTTLVIHSFCFSQVGRAGTTLGRCLPQPTLSLSLSVSLSRSLSRFPNGWRPFTFSLLSGHVFHNTPLSLVRSLLACAFRTCSLRTIFELKLFLRWGTLAAKQPQKRISTLGRCGCLDKMLMLAAKLVEY